MGNGCSFLVPRAQAYLVCRGITAPWLKLFLCSTHTHTHSYTYCPHFPQRKENMKCTLQLGNNFARDYDKGEAAESWQILARRLELGQLIKRQRAAFAYLLHNILVFITPVAWGGGGEGGESMQRVAQFLLNPEQLFQLDCLSRARLGQWNAYGRLILFNVRSLSTPRTSCGPIVGNPLIRLPPLPPLCQRERFLSGHIFRAKCSSPGNAISWHRKIILNPKILKRFSSGFPPPHPLPCTFSISVWIQFAILTLNAFSQCEQVEFQLSIANVCINTDKTETL